MTQDATSDSRADAARELHERPNLCHTDVSHADLSHHDFSTLEPDPERYRRTRLLHAEGLRVLHLALGPGQRVPEHRHPGCRVLVQGLEGSITVRLDGETLALEPRSLISFGGERLVSLANDSAAPSAALITLAG